jgi:zinc protease
MPAPASTAAAPVRTVLPNGLVVIAEERRLADTVAFQLSTRAGSRDDAGELGINWITTRMLFQGTPRRPSETDVERAATRAGGTIARGISVELISLTSRMASAEADLGLDLLSDLVLNPLLDPGALSRQKQIALQDQAFRRADPSALLADVFQGNMFEGHPGSTPITGAPETVQAITREAVQARHAAYWGAANMVLTIVGRLSTDEALRRAERFFGGAPAGQRIERPRAQQRILTAPDTVRAAAGQQQAQFRLGFLAPDLLHPDRPAMTILTAIMGGASGRLFEEVRNQRGLAYVASAGYTVLTDAGAWYATAGVDPRNMDAALDVVRAEINRLKAGPPPAEEVARRISQIAGQQVVADEGNAARASRLASEEILGTESTEEFVRKLRQVTPEAVQAVAQRYLDLDRALLVVVAPA